MERWKEIPSFLGMYEASTKGNVRKIIDDKRHQVIKPFVKNKNQAVYFVRLIDSNGTRHSRTLCSVIAETFLSKPGADYVSYHKNGLKSDHELMNIAYIHKRELGKKTGSATRKTLVQIDGDGCVLKSFSSLKQAAIEQKVSESAISRCCHRTREVPFAPDGNLYAWDNGHDIYAKSKQFFEWELQSELPLVQLSRFRSPTCLLESVAKKKCQLFRNQLSDKKMQRLSDLYAKALALKDTGCDFFQTKEAIRLVETVNRYIREYHAQKRKEWGALHGKRAGSYY